MQKKLRMLEIFLASTNRHKAAEIEKFLEGVAKILIYDRYIPPEEKGKTFRENALIKALSLSTLLPGKLILGEDSGLVVPYLGGAPGVNSHRFSDTGSDIDNIKFLLEKMKSAHDEERRAYFVSYGVLVKDGKILWEGEGRVHGCIDYRIVGEGGFGYDPVFYYPPLKKTFAQLSRDEKNRVSHRGAMLRKLRSFLLDLKG